MTLSNKKVLLGLSLIGSALGVLSIKTAASQSNVTATAVSTSAVGSAPAIETVPERIYSGFDGQINAVIFLSDGGGLIAVGADGSSRSFDVNTALIRQTFSTATGPSLFNLSISPATTDPIFATSGYADDTQIGTVYLYEIQTGKLLMKLYTKASIDDLAFIPPDGKYLIAASEDKTLSVFDTTASSQPIKVFDNSLYDAKVSALMVNKAGTMLLTGADDGTVRLWKFDRAALTLTQIVEYDGLGETDPSLQVVNSVAFSPDEKSILAGNQAGKAILWDMQTGTKLGTFVGHTNSVNFVDFFPNGTQILTASDDGTARIWDIASEQIVCTAQVASGIQDASISPDGSTFLTASIDTPNLQLWQVCPTDH